MKNSINLKDFNTNKTKQKKRTYYDRLNEAVKTGFPLGKDTLIEKENSIIYKFHDVVLISNNDLLRIKFNLCTKYKNLWKERVENLSKRIENKDIFKNKKVKIEYLLETNKSVTLDYDSAISSTKFITDGFVNSGLLIDDNLNYVPLILSNQKKVKKNEVSKLYAIITVVDDEYLKSLYSDDFNSCFYENF